MRSVPKAVLASIVAVALAACSSGGGSSPPQQQPTTHVVTLSWIPNREAGVNKAGGGYRITISGQAPLDVPWTVGPLAPTSKDVTLPSGDYSVRIQAYAALDAQGGQSGTLGAQSQAITVHVP